MVEQHPDIAGLTCTETGMLPLHAAVAGGHLPLIKLVKDAAALAERVLASQRMERIQGRQKERLEKDTAVASAESGEMARLALLQEEWAGILSEENHHDDAPRAPGALGGAALALAAVETVVADQGLMHETSGQPLEYSLPCSCLHSSKERTPQGNARQPMLVAEECSPTRTYQGKSASFKPEHVAALKSGQCCAGMSLAVSTHDE